MDRGFQLAVLALCFVMAAGALASLGVYGVWGVSVDPGQQDPSEDLDESEKLVDPTTDSNEGIVESFVDTITPGLGIIRELFGALRGTSSILAAVGIPGALAVPIGAVTTIAIGITFAKFVRGVG